MLNIFQMQYLCTTFNFETATRNDYFQHLQTHEENYKEYPPIKRKIPKHKCLLCNYQTNRKTRLKAHEKDHSNNFEWKCAQCNYKTSRESNLLRHSKSIHEKFRYYCDLCPYNTTRTNYLKEHIKFVHKTNEKTL
jgi:KRAB domain-containing zinc finger protein